MTSFQASPLRAGLARYVTVTSGLGRAGDSFQHAPKMKGGEAEDHDEQKIGDTPAAQTACQLQENAQRQRGQAEPLQSSANESGDSHNSSRLCAPISCLLFPHCISHNAVLKCGFGLWFCVVSDYVVRDVAEGGCFVGS